MNASKTMCQLTNRELEVLELISLGFSIKEIGKSLYISNHTVVTYKRNLLNKLEARNMPHLIKKAYEFKILKIEL